MSGLVHPDLMGSLKVFYPSRCTLQAKVAAVAPATGVDAYGRPNTSWADVTGLVGIPCSVNKPVRNTAQEIRRTEMTVVDNTHRIALAGYYPAVTTAMTALVDGAAYNVLSVEHDAQHASTWLLAEVVTT